MQGASQTAELLQLKMHGKNRQGRVLLRLAWNELQKKPQLHQASKRWLDVRFHKTSLAFEMFGDEELRKETTTPRARSAGENWNGGAASYASPGESTTSDGSSSLGYQSPSAHEQPGPWLVRLAFEPCVPRAEFDSGASWLLSWCRDGSGHTHRLYGIHLLFGYGRGTECIGQSGEAQNQESL